MKETGQMVFETYCKVPAIGARYYIGLYIALIAFCEVFHSLYIEKPHKHILEEDEEKEGVPAVRITRLRLCKLNGKYNSNAKKRIPLYF